jgi:hypothetical protein
LFLVFGFWFYFFARARPHCALCTDRSCMFVVFSTSLLVSSLGLSVYWCW